MLPAPLSTGFRSFTLLPTIKLGPSGGFLSGWACAHPRPLWVSPTTSPVRLGVSPAAAPTPMELSLRGLRLYFPVLELWVARCALLPAVCPVYLCANVGPRGATHCSACPVLRHSESGPLGLSARTWGRRVCQWSDCLPRWSYTPPVSVPHGLSLIHI